MNLNLYITFTLKAVFIITNLVETFKYLNGKIASHCVILLDTTLTFQKYFE